MFRNAATDRQIALRRKGRGNCEIRPEELYEIADALELLEKIGRAWHVEGPRPDYHRKQKLILAKDWPALYSNLSHL